VFVITAVLASQITLGQDLLLINGKIFTGNRLQPYAEAVLIRDDNILAVGNQRELTPIANHAQVLDLDDKTLLPGLIDSHAHAVLGGVALLAADAKNETRDISELEGFVAQAKSSGRGMRGDVLVVTGIPLAIWSENDALNRRFNSGAYANQPLFLGGMDGHTGWSNLALRKRAGLTRAFISRLPEGKRKYYGIGKDLTPNGFAVDEGLEIIQKKIPDPDANKYLAGARAAQSYLISLGITSWLDAAVDASIFEAYRRLAAGGELKVHVAALPVVDPNDSNSFKAALALRAKYSNVPNLTIPGVKVYADGVVEYPAQSAAMTAPYVGTGKRGDLLFKPERFAELCIEADKLGLLVHTHAIGDLAVHETLNGYEAARKVNGYSGVPHTITHLQFVRSEDIGRFKSLGVLASYQLLWARAGVTTVELVKPYVEPGIYTWQYPARSMLDAGATIAGASDWDVTTPEVFKAIYEAETRRGTQGVLDANQDMPREAMLYAYTINAARAMREEARIGSIEPGKAADLTLVDRDVLTVPAEEMRDTRVLWTMIAGKWVYHAEAQH
jgi:predicted amidohydrolase YtcJ